MNRFPSVLFATGCMIALLGCGGDAGSSRAAALPTPTPGLTGDALSGGDTTVFGTTANAFGQPARNLPLDRRNDFFVGNAFFNRNWVTAPSSTAGVDGLGPVFNARSCSSCHFKDGRGRPPLDAGEPMLSMLIRLSIPGAAEDGGPRGDPHYGDQLNPDSILGVPREGRAVVEYEERYGTFADGAAFRLRAPRYVFYDLAFGPLGAEVRLSPRVAPFLIGLGLLAAIDEETLLGLADENDADHDGISGRPNWVWDRRRQETVIGRFGWKANQPTLEQQNAGAFLGDIGLTSPLFPEENCPPVQVACLAAPNGGEPELDQQKIDIVTFYTHFLAVPARRDLDDPIAERGEVLFSQTGCAGCHAPTIVTGAVAEFPELSGQTIHPYSDLLLHDMGDDLADGRPDFEASGREWRTPPLWGIGLVATVNGHTSFLHDGRARNLGEAILWHDGEARASRELFRRLPEEDRSALLRFLASL